MFLQGAGTISRTPGSLLGLDISLRNRIGQWNASFEMGTGIITGGDLKC